MTGPQRLNPHDSAASGCVFRQLALQSLALLVVSALALSALGPMLDHHFAERHPGHLHLYLGSAGPDHSHSYQDNHSHNGSQMYGPAEKGKPPEGVAFVMPNDGTGHLAADIAAPLLVRLLRLGGGGGIIRQPFTADGALTGVVVFPSKRPPRA